MKKMECTFLEWWEGAHRDFRGILFDVDGTLIAGKNLMPGADRMIDWLRQNEFPYYLLTNDGNNSPQEKSELIQRTGLDIPPEEIVSCSMALNSYTKEHDAQGKRFFVMGDLGDPNYAELAGLEVCREVDDIGQCDGIIVGEGVYDWHKNINAVINAFVSNPDLPMLVPNPDSYWPNGPDGEVGVGAGGKARFIAMILDEMGIQLKPLYLGKPYPAIFKYALGLLKSRFQLDDDLPEKQILMIGDSLKSDILGAKRFGLSSALMLTGITSIEQVNATEASALPDYVFTSFCDVL